jgi:multidrug efflux pump subunit AcrB
MPGRERLRVWLAKMDNNIFTQIGLVVLVGLAAKNAILIVEFAKQLQDQGKGRREATLEACRLRRPRVFRGRTGLKQ